jgi:hypothetical protein
MRIGPIFLLALVAALLPASTAAQTIRAGMTAAEVRAVLGEPALTRSAGEWSYLFYPNGCAPRCGSDDVVFLRDGRVVTAVFRTRRRRFAGPRPSTALEGAEGGAPASGARVLGTPATPAAGRRTDAAPPETEGARVRGIRVQVPGTENVSTGGETVIRPGDARRGAPAAADTALDQSRQERERRVNPRTIPRDRPGGVQADTAADRARQRRERQVTPRTIPPDTTRRP